MTLEARHPRPLPRSAPAWLMGLLTVSLSILFLAGTLVYAIVRIQWARPDPVTGLAAMPWGTFAPPFGLFASTGLLLLSGVSYHLSVVAVRREAQRDFRRYFTLAFGFAVLFLLVQVPSAWGWLAGHFQAVADMKQAAGVGAAEPSGRRHAFAGATVFLVGLHALHVAVGLGYFTVMLRRALRGEFDHEYHMPVRMLGWYWHFLEAVWLVLLGVFVVLR